MPVLAGHILRFEARYAAARQAIEAGDLGGAGACHERIGLVGDQDILRGRTTIPLYYGVHELDLARWFAGEVQRIYAERSEGVLRAHGYEVEDLYWWSCASRVGRTARRRWAGHCRDPCPATAWQGW